jgi:hypothetical protein
MVRACWVRKYSPIVDSDLNIEEDYDFDEEAYHKD